MPPQDDLQFDRAVASGGQAALPCVVCGRPIAGQYFEANGKVVCESCKRTVEAEWEAGGATSRFGRAVGLGVLAMVVCSIVWYLVLVWTDSQWGILAIGVGLLVGGAVRKGSNGRGGWRYQALAIFLTYTAIVSSYVPFVLEGMRESQAVTAADSTAASAPIIKADGKDSGTAVATTEAGTADAPGAVAMVVALVVLVLVLYATPFLTAVQAPIGLLIIGFALYEAWKLNARVELKITGPYQLGARA